ncbi:MAG: glycoside hydrolase family 2 TIM barrel-domain containing protein [Lentisphaerota bacterium]
MIVNGSDIITRQLSIGKETKVSFDSKHHTVLNPVRFTPEPEESRLSLDGEWLVKYYPFKDKAVTGSTANWQSVQQPGKVFYADPEAEKQPIENWNRVSLSHIDDNDGAILRRTVRIPKNWRGKRVFLRFDSVYPAGIFYLNGQKLGAHYSGLTPVEFEVTGQVEAGKDAEVAVRLLRKHKFVKMDMPRHALEFAGLAQSAYFFTVEKTCIKEYHLITGLDKSFKHGTVSGKITLDNPTAGALLVELSRSGTSVATFSADTTSTQDCYNIVMEVANPDLWNDEYPNLYEVKIVLAAARQQPQLYRYSTGFRRLDLSPKGPKLNGSFIKFRGVNHLTFHPEYGMYTPKDWLRKCLDLMKKANVNAIRTHFLSPPALAELCDEMGFYLLQELPIDWGTNYIHDPEWVGPALMRLEGGIRRDRHHPSIMAWSVGNENMPESQAVAADGWNHLRIYDQFCHLLDPSRPTMFPPPGPANKIRGIFELRVGEIADIHYSFVLQKQFRDEGRIVNPNSWEGDMVEITREEALKRGWSGCWFSSEYGIFCLEPDMMNSPYLSVIADEKIDPLSGRNTLEVFYERLKNEWGNMRHDPACLGGAYFPWLCCGAGKGAEGNPWGWTRWGEDANWGVITADLLPKPQFWALRVLFAPVWFPARISWKPGEKYLKFKITNQYNAIDLSECVIRTQQNGGGTWMCMVRQFRDVKISCAPGKTVEVKIPVWCDSLKNALDKGNFGYCRISLLDPKGFCPVKADILIIPESMQQKDDMGMPVGPDAIL